LRKLCLLLVVVCAASLSAQVRHLDQNWSERDRQWFYTTPQGSKLILYDWAFALERADSEALWIENLERFYFLTNAQSSVNPDGLPVGIVRDDQHLGLTCAACHTNQVQVRGTTYQIDGGPTNADLYAFLADLGESVKATSRGASDPKFLRFAKRVLKNKDNAANRATLFAKLRDYDTYFAGFIKASTPNVTWGRARTDAFGMIFNRVTAIDLKIPSNSEKPDAPVSYPFLWDTSWHNKVQWNGSAPNSFVVERLARNVGEVLGVFAQIELKKPTFLHWYYESTAKRLNLLEIEDRLANLRSPKWQSEWAAIDQTKAARGQQLYAAQCESCHKIATPGRHQNIVMTPLSAVRTDKTMATVAATREAKTGVLQGVREMLIFGKRMGPTAGAGAITFNAVIGAILSPVEMRATESAEDARPTSDDIHDDDRARLRAALLQGPQRGEHEARPSSTNESVATEAAPREDLLTTLKSLAARKKTQTDTATELAYKARPLDGIWATGPYLHNGSVPTIDDLLKKPADRPRTFHVGSRELDLVKMGFVSTPVEGSFLFDTSIEGNRNTGHEWGTSLSAQERADLIEYLKTL
jgi:mono/diheme cytochrome c family protein